jgi:hypothetical protein
LEITRTTTQLHIPGDYYKRTEPKALMCNDSHDDRAYDDEVGVLNCAFCLL